MTTTFRTVCVAASLVMAGSACWWWGRQIGVQDGRTMRRTVRWAASPAPGLPEGPKTLDGYRLQIDEQVARGAEGQPTETRRDAAVRLYDLGQSAHFRNAGNGDLSLRAYREALTIVRAIGDRTREADILANLSETQSLLGRHADAERSLRAAVAIRERGVGVPSQLADLLNRLGDHLRQQGKTRDARRVLDRALGMEQASGHLGQQGDCLRALGQLAFEEGQLSVARQFLRTASWKYAAAGMADSRAALWGQIGDIALAQGRTDEAEELYAKGLQAWRERKQGFWTGRFLARQAMVALARKDPQTAERLATEALELLRASNGPVAAAWALHALGEAAHHRGDIAAARRHHGEALALREKVGHVWAIRQSREALARCDAAPKA